MTYVSTYKIDQCYGGPEEGGWWYDWYTLVDTLNVDNEDVAIPVRQARLGSLEKAKCHAASIPEGNSPYLDTEGYIPTGFSVETRYDIVIEEQPGDNSTTERPHYE